MYVQTKPNNLYFAGKNHVGFNFCSPENLWHYLPETLRYHVTTNIYEMA